MKFRSDRLNNIKDSKYLWYGLSTAIIFILIYLADFKKFLESISQVEKFYMSLAFISGLSVFLIWGYAWNRFFRINRTGFSVFKCYKILMAGNFMNSVTPLGQLGGEPFMAYIVSENTDMNYERGLSTVISADVINAVPFVTFGILGVVYSSLFGVRAGLGNLIYIGIFIPALILLIIYLMWFKSEKLEETAHRLINWLEDMTGYKKVAKRIRSRISKFSEALRETGGNKRELVKIGVVSHLAPVMQMTTIYLILLGLGITPNLEGVFLTFILSSLAMFSPTPGGTGTYEAAFSGLLVYFFPAVGLDVAVAAAVLFRLTNFWPGIIIGYFALVNLRS